MAPYGVVRLLKVKNMQVQTRQKFQKAFSSWVGAGASPQCVVCFGITSNDELLFPAVAVVSDVHHFFGWWWFI
jgi:hypothetical protein